MAWFGAGRGCLHQSHLDQLQVRVFRLLYLFAALALRLFSIEDLIERSSARRFGDFSDWVNVFKPGKGTITIWENTGGSRGKQLYQLKGIPLTPGAP